MIKTQEKLIDIINRNRVLYNLNPDIIDDDFPGGGGGGTGGGGNGTTSANTVPALYISPSENQSIAIGTTLCFTASGNMGFPQESEQVAGLNGGCSATSSGTWVKNCGTNGQPDAEAYDTRTIHKNRPFQFTGRNGTFNSPASPLLNTHILLGVRTINGYYFYWDVYRYCASTSVGCTSRWMGSIRMSTPQGNQITFATGFVEFNQLFRIRSDGNRISWDYTTENNWIYNRYYITIPEDVGEFQFFVNGLFLNNQWDDLKTLRGSYQSTPTPNDFVWTSDCVDNLVVTGNKACYTPVIAGHCKICVALPNLQPKCVSVVATPLTLTPVNAECRSCGETEECENIPDPTQPVISVTSIDVDSIRISWNDSISLTSGLFYEVKVNSVIETTLDSTVILSSLETGSYNISVRAIDACGASDWSVEVIYEIVAEDDRDAGPADFALTEVPYEGDRTSDLNSYEATWEEVVGADSYEIWVGDPQSYILVTTSDLFYDFISLTGGIYLSVRGKYLDGSYTLFSNITQVP